MRSAGQRCSKRARTPARSMLPMRRTAATAASQSSTMKPVTPSSTTSGTEPQRNATTGVPQAIASIITSPNGSGQSIGNSSAAALPRRSALCASSTSPTYSTPGCAATSGATWRSQ